MEERHTSPPHQRRRAVLLILALAVVLRLGWLLLVPVQPVSDSVRYDFFAQRIASGQGYTEIDGRATAYWPVGPSFLYALPYRLMGPENAARYPAAAVLNLLLGVGSVALTIYLGRRWIGPGAGLLAGVLLACWPSQIEFTTVLASETPMLFLMLAGLAVWYARGWPGWTRAVAAGICFAAASYMRPTVLLVPVVVAALDFMRQPQRLATFGYAALLGVVMAACIAPWTYRNYRVFDTFVPISTNGGVNLWMGNNPSSAGAYVSPPPATEMGGEASRDRILKNEAVHYIKGDLAGFIKRTLVKAVRLHERETIGVGWNEPALTRQLARVVGDRAERAVQGLKLLSTGYWWLMLALAGVGFVQLIRKRGAWFAVYCPAFALSAYFAAVHAITVIQDRYHFAYIPLVAMLAAAVWPRGIARDEVSA